MNINDREGEVGKISPPLAGAIINIQKQQADYCFACPRRGRQIRHIINTEEGWEGGSGASKLDKLKRLFVDDNGLLIRDMSII